VSDNLQGIVDLVLLAGGLATRLYPQTKTIPKALITVAGRPFIDHQLAWLEHQGMQRVVICVGHLGEQIQNYLRKNYRGKLDIDFSFDPDPLLGTGGAIRQALTKVEESFFVMYGDSYLPISLAPIADYYGQVQTWGLMTVFQNRDQWDTSNVEFVGGKIRRYDKIHKTADMLYIDYGLSILNQKAFTPFSEKAIFDLSEVFIRLLQQEQLAGFEVHNRFYEMGSPQGLKETEAYLKHHLPGRSI
jgi:N-acetyl-alpha-D-muramate 1-phosphate uridylyltransferase